MEIKDMINLAEKLMSLRKEKGMSQMELAEKLNVSRQAISRWEVGAAVPSTDNLKMLSELYGVSVDYLLNDAVENPSKNTENQELLSERQRKNPMILLVFAAIIVAAVAVASFTMAFREEKQDLVMPIENMDVVDANGYTTYTFSFE